MGLPKTDLLEILKVIWGHGVNAIDGAKPQVSAPFPNPLSAINATTSTNPRAAMFNTVDTSLARLQASYIDISFG